MEQELPEFHGLMGSFPQDRAKAHTLNTKLRKQLTEFRAPQVMMYVKEKILNGELEKAIKMWERKVEIAEVSLLSPGRQSRITKHLKPSTCFFRICLPG